MTRDLNRRIVSIEYRQRTGGLRRRVAEDAALTTF